jgi:hypothetical protein
VFAIEDAPNVVANSLISQIGPASAINNPAKIGGNLIGSLVYGGETMTTLGSSVRNTHKIEGSFLSFGATSNGSELIARSLATAPALAARTAFITDSVILRPRVGGQLCASMDPGAGGTNAVTNIVVSRGFFGVSTTANNGLLAPCMSNASGDAMRFFANGLTVSTVTPSANGLGRGGAGGGTLEGVRIENALVEATSAPTAATAYGARATVTSWNAASITPDTGTGAPLSAYVGPAAGVRLPRVLGLAEFGTEQALAGDLFNAQPQLWTTNSDLLSALGH